MDDSLYDTSWTLYAVHSLTTSFRDLFTAPPPSSKPRSLILDKHASEFQKHLTSDRPRYEDEEEKDKLGGLRSCTWTRLETTSKATGQDTGRLGRKRKRARQDDGINDVSLEPGLLVSLVYDKATYKYITFVVRQVEPTTKRTRTFSSSASAAEPMTNTAIVLAKASSSTFKAFSTYLSDTFAIRDVEALKLPPVLLQSTLATYISSVYTELLRNTSQRQVPLDMRTILGTVKLTISFSPPVAPSLKTLDVEVPSESVLVALKELETGEDETSPQTSTTTGNVLDVLSKWVHGKTGLKLPLREPGEELEPPTADEPTDTAKAAPPLRISRVLSAAYAISSEGRLKFALKPAEACDGAGGDESDTERIGLNVVRAANEALLVAIMREAIRQRREDA